MGGRGEDRPLQMAPQDDTLSLDGSNKSSIYNLMMAECELSDEFLTSQLQTNITGNPKPSFSKVDMRRCPPFYHTQVDEDLEETPSSLYP